MITQGAMQLSNEKYEYLAESIDGNFLKYWAISTQEIESDVIDDLAMYCMCDGI